MKASKYTGVNLCQNLDQGMFLHEYHNVDNKNDQTKIQI